MLKRLLKSAIIAMLIGFVMAVGALVLSTIYVVVRGKSASIPGLVEYVQTDQQLTFSPSEYFPLTILLCVLAAFPLVLRMTSRRARIE